MVHKFSHLVHLPAGKIPPQKSSHTHKHTNTHAPPLTQKQTLPDSSGVQRPEASREALNKMVPISVLKKIYWGWGDRVKKVAQGRIKSLQATARQYKARHYIELYV